MSKLGTKNNPAIIKIGPNSKQEEIIGMMARYGIQYIAGLENEENLDDLRGLISKEDFNNIADPDALSTKVQLGVQSLLAKKTSRSAPCPCGSGKQYKRCCGK